MDRKAPATVEVAGVPIAKCTPTVAAEWVLSQTTERKSRCVYAANVHMVMEAYDHPDFRDVLRSADLVLADGMPLVWWQRFTGAASGARCYGPQLMLDVCALAAQRGVPIGLYGGAPSALAKLRRVLSRRFNGLEIAYSYSPPFHDLPPEDDCHIVNEISKSGARILFVSLGCPKQEKWMYAHRTCVPAVMIGVGAGFDFISGTKRQAPNWMQRNGLEWVFRFTTEPRRLAARYLKHNPRFALLLVRHWFTCIMRQSAIDG